MNVLIEKIQRLLGRWGAQSEGAAVAGATGVKPLEMDKPAVGHQSLYDIIKDCADLLTQLEEMDGRLEEKARPLAEHIRINLQEIVERAGAIRIEDETTFDVARHQSIPVSRISHGTPITETVEVGYEFMGRVIKRAKVRVGAK